MSEDKVSETKQNILLGETTFLSIGMVVALISFAMFISSINANSEENSENIKKLETKIRTVEQDNKKIIEELGEIKGILKVIVKKVNK